MFIISFSLSQYKSNTDIDAVNKVYGEIWEYESTIFKCDNKKYEILFYNSTDNTTFEAVLKKRNFGNETRYKSEIIHTGILNSYNNEWKKINSKLRYIIVSNEDDIEEFDCNGYIPIKEKLHYAISDGTYITEWIYIIDESQDRN